MYHLDRPRKFLEAIAQNCRKVLVLWTHVAHAELNEAAKTYSLSGLCENEGLRGRWYPEHGDIPQSELDQLKWASWANEKSFWIQIEYLLQLLKSLGFDLVFERFDCMDDIFGDMTKGFYKKIDRVMLVAIKSGVQTGQPPKIPETLVPPLEQLVPTAGERVRFGEERDWTPEQAAAAANSRASVAECELLRAHAMLEAIYGSTCWRLTAPLRRRWVILGVHSRILDADLLRLFHGDGWILEHEKPTQFRFAPEKASFESMVIADGTQIWRNPRMVS